jgi:hypothetical protein
MKRMIPFVILLIFGLPILARAEERTLVVNWTAKDINGVEVKIPAKDRPTVVAFVRADQQQSKDTLKEIQARLTDPKLAQAIAIVSGPTSAEGAKQVAGNLPAGWVVVADPDFAASGQMAIHVWPTTLVIKPDGAQAAHLAGSPDNLATYLDYASSKLDDAGLKARLAAREVVTDSPTQAAARHFQTAQRLLDQGQLEPARAELNEGLKLAPNDPMLALLSARVSIQMDKPKDAIDVLDRLPAGSAPQFQVSLLRGRALIAMQKWSDAKAVLPEALKLNPSPAEVHYLLGLCYQHDQDFAHAADEFRLAIEARDPEHKVAVK